MSKIIQVEELVYSRLPKVSEADWIEMLSKQGVSKSYAILMDNYFLVEQSDYRFDKDEYICSKRIVFNTDFATYDNAENTASPKNTETIVTFRYDSKRDLHFVYHTHFSKSENQRKDFPFIFSEADTPASLPSSQIPSEADLKKDVETHDEHLTVNKSISSIITKITTFSYNYSDFRWSVGSIVSLDELFSGPTALIGNPSYQFRRKALFVFMQSNIANHLRADAEYEIPANTGVFMRKYQEKYSSKSPRIFLFVCDDGKVASFYDEVQLVRANKNSITIKSLLRV